jgi:hypothetical protein
MDFQMRQRTFGPQQHTQHIQTDAVTRTPEARNWRSASVCRCLEEIRRSVAIIRSVSKRKQALCLKMQFSCKNIVTDSKPSGRTHRVQKNNSSVICPISFCCHKGKYASFSRPFRMTYEFCAPRIADARVLTSIILELTQINLNQAAVRH